MVSLDISSLNSLQAKFGEYVVETKLDDHDTLYVQVDPNFIVQIAEFIHEDLGFIHANFCMGTDLDDKIEVSWYLGNPEYSTILVIRVHLNHENPEVHSLISLWSGMDWHERETYEMLGVNFMNHGDLRRLILPELWDGYPLRNDYVYLKPKYRKPEDELMS